MGALEKIIALVSTGQGDGNKKAPGPYQTGDLTIGNTDPYIQGPSSSGVDYHKEAREKDEANWTQEDRNLLYEHGRNRFNGIRDESNTDEVRDSLDPNWRNNHAKNNVRGNFNRKSFRSTLNLSRAADALNNKRHWIAGDIGARTNSEFGSTGIELPHSERWEPVETQEMRQMRANEAVDMQARMRDVNRQANLLDYPQELQRQADQSKFGLANLISTSDMNISNAMRNAAVNINMNLPAQQRFAQYMQMFANELALRTGDRKMQLVAKAFNEHNDALGQLYAQYYLGQSGFTRRDAANSQIIQELFGTYGNNPQMFNSMVSIMGLLGSLTTADIALGGIR